MEIRRLYEEKQQRRGRQRIQGARPPPKQASSHEERHHHRAAHHGGLAAHERRVEKNRRERHPRRGADGDPRHPRRKLDGGRQEGDVQPRHGKEMGGPGDLHSLQEGRVEALPASQHHAPVEGEQRFPRGVPARRGRRTRRRAPCMPAAHSPAEARRAPPRPVRRTPPAPIRPCPSRRGSTSAARPAGGRCLRRAAARTPGPPTAQQHPGARRRRAAAQPLSGQDARDEGGQGLEDGAHRPPETGEPWEARDRARTGRDGHARRRREPAVYASRRDGRPGAAGALMPPRAEARRKKRAGGLLAKPAGRTNARLLRPATPAVHRLEHHRVVVELDGGVLVVDVELALDGEVLDRREPGADGRSGSPRPSSRGVRIRIHPRERTTGSK